MTSQDIYRCRLVEIHSWQDITKNMRRIVFYSSEFADYPEVYNGAPFKIFLAKDGVSVPQLPIDKPPYWLDSENIPFARTYTIRNFDRQNCTLTVDFALHGENGVASKFASCAEKGKVVGISTPRRHKPLLFPADYYLFVGDLTALPAIHSMVEILATNAIGEILLCLPSVFDLPQDFVVPSGVRVQIFCDDYQGLITTVKTIQMAHQNTQIWVAGELSIVKELRNFARKNWNFDRKKAYFVPFWKDGSNEDFFHAERHQFIDDE